MHFKPIRYSTTA